MPIFEYVCQECGEPFEELVLNSGVRIEVFCPECGGAEVRRKMSTFASKVTGKGSFSYAPQASSSCSSGNT